MISMVLADLKLGEMSVCPFINPTARAQHRHFVTVQQLLDSAGRSTQRSRRIV